jgi:glycosyltransferase involved in cell wall biosynthesis
LFDRFSGWEQRLGVSQLVNRLPGDRFSHRLAAIEAALAWGAAPSEHRVEIISRFGRIAPLAGPDVSRFVTRRKVDLIHAWGPAAAAAARDSGSAPIVLELFDPVLAARHVKMIRTLVRPKGSAVVCSCELVRRRLIEGGVTPEACVVIRPGVDFGLINRCRQRGLREQLGVTPADYLVTVPEPVTPEGGQFDAFWAAAMINYLDGGMRVILPGRSRERERIGRFAVDVPGPPAMLDLQEPVPFEELVSVCDALVVAPRGDISTTSIAWAMAAETAVIGSAVQAVTELIASKVNGLLFKQVPGKSMATSITRLLEDRESQAKAKNIARGQAYELFSVRRCIDQHARLYENLLSAAAPGEGIVDSRNGVLESV